MLIHRGLQVAPLLLLSSGGLLVPTPLRCVSPRVLLGHRWLVLSSQQGHSPPIGLSLFTPMPGIHHLIWIYANVARILYQRKLPPPQRSPPLSQSPLFFPLFSFLSFFSNCCHLCSVWEPAMEDQICFVTGIYLEGNSESWLLISSHRNTAHPAQTESKTVTHWWYIILTTDLHRVQPLR